MRLSTLRPFSKGAAVALAAAALAFSPVAAHADDSPTATTTSTPAPVTTTTSDPTTSTSSTSSATSTDPSGTADPTSTTGSSTTAPPATSTTSTTSTSPSTSPTTKAAKTGALAFATPRLADQSVAAVSPAADFLATTLAASGDHYNYAGTTSLEGGNTIDAALGLDGAGEGLDEADAAVAYVEDHLSDYVTGEAFGDAGSTYAGPLAKALVAAVAQGADPAHFGGTNLVTRLQGLQAPSGRFSDVSSFGDNSNTVGQSLAIIGLGRAGAAVSTA